MIYENYQFQNIGELMLGGDHYKWRVMLSNGVDEKFIRGDASWHDKWLAFAASLKYCIGNPMFHWTHLELRRVFGIEEILSEKTAEDIWNRANALLATEEYQMCIRDRTGTMPIRESCSIISMIVFLLMYAFLYECNPRARRRRKAAKVT